MTVPEENDAKLARLKETILYPKEELNSWPDEMFDTPLQRARLQSRLIAVEVRLKNLDAIERLICDGEEISDGARLANLYGRRKIYLESELQLPFVQEPVRQLRSLANLPLDEMTRMDPTNEPDPNKRRILCRLQNAELKLIGAERWIRDWKENLPEWREWYDDVETRMTARAAAKLQDKPAGTTPKNSTPEEDIPIELKETIPADLGRFIDRLWKSGNLADSINSRTAAFRLAQGIIHNGKPLNSETLRTNTIKPASSKKL